MYTIDLTYFKLSFHNRILLWHFDRTMFEVSSSHFHLKFFNTMHPYFSHIKRCIFLRQSDWTISLKVTAPLIFVSTCAYVVLLLLIKLEFKRQKVWQENICFFLFKKQPLITCYLSTVLLLDRHRPY